MVPGHRGASGVRGAVIRRTGGDGGQTSAVRTGLDLLSWQIERPPLPTPSETFTNDPTGAIQWLLAISAPVGDRFGPRSCSGCTPFHHGTDFLPGDGAPVQAISAGVVREVDNGDGELGVHVVIDHETIARADASRDSTVAAVRLAGSPLRQRSAPSTRPPPPEWSTPLRSPSPSTVPVWSR